MASTVTGFSDMDPSPRAVIDIDDADLDGSTETVTIWQVSKWGQVPVNRQPRSAVGGLVLTDYEIPPGVPVTYKVEQFDADGISLGLVLSLTTQVDIPIGMAVVQDPLAPALAVLVPAEVSFAGQLGRSRASKRYQAGGHTFAMSGAYSGFTQTVLRVATTSELEREAMAAVLEQTMILVRTMPQMRLPGAFYAMVPEVPMIPINARAGGNADLWDLVGDEVSRPMLDVLVPIYTYDRFKAYLDTLHPPTPGTYDDAAAIWATYIDAMRNPPPEV